MAISDKLSYLAETKTAIRQAITDQGVEVSADEPFRGYAAKIGEISGGSAGEPLDPAVVYAETRPSDWLPMVTPQNDEIYLLFHIPVGTSALIAFTVTCTDSYTVEIGGTLSGGLVVDGEVMSASFQADASLTQTVTGGSQYENELAASDFGSVTADGHAQCMIKISGEAITAFAPSTHTKKTSPSRCMNWNIVEIACRCESATSMKLDGGAQYCGSLTKLRYFAMYGTNNITAMNAMFDECYSLIAVLALDTSKATNMNGMFSYCYSLVAIPALDMGSVLYMNSMFSYCRSLTAVPELDTSKVTDLNSLFLYCQSLPSVPALDTSKATNMSSMFSNCYTLTSVPTLDTSIVTNMSSMFFGCQSLTAVPELDTSKATSMSSMFASCQSLTSVPALDTSNVTSMSSMFSGCYALREVPALDTGKVTSMYAMFQNCYALTSVPALDTSKVTNMNYTFSNCCSLGAFTFAETMEWTAPQDVTFANCSMCAEALRALIASLPTVTEEKTLTVTGNPGAADLTEEDIAVATGKGWTVTI